MTAPDSSAALGPLMQIALSTHDVPRMTAFYRDQLGLTHLFDAGPKLSFFDLGSVRLMITEPSSPELDHPPSPLYFRVTDIIAAHNQLLANGVVEERPPALTAKMPDHELWTSFLRDCDQNLFALMSEKSTQP